MNDLFVAQTKHTPELDFRFSTHTLSMKGESFPENAGKFYGGILAQIREYLDSLNQTEVQVNVNLTYFNSASTKLIFKLFSNLNQACEKGNPVTVNWHFDEEDDTLREFGEEIRTEYPSLLFNLRSLSST